jgi:hypothetical protein
MALAKMAVRLADAFDSTCIAGKPIDIMRMANELRATLIALDLKPADHDVDTWANDLSNPALGDTPEP